MMRAKGDPKALTKILYSASVVVLAGALAGMVLPHRTIGPIQTNEKKQIHSLRGQEETAKKDAAAAAVRIMTRTWKGDLSSVQDQVLSLVARMTKAHGVNQVRLQPTRVTDDGSTLEQVPFLLVVEGPFPAVAALERELESPTHRLAVNLMQVTSTDSESNKVTASLGLTAFRQNETVKTETKDAKHS